MWLWEKEIIQDYPGGDTLGDVTMKTSQASRWKDVKEPQTKEHGDP